MTSTPLSIKRSPPWGRINKMPSPQTISGLFWLLLGVLTLTACQPSPADLQATIDAQVALVVAATQSALPTATAYTTAAALPTPIPLATATAFLHSQLCPRPPRTPQPPPTPPIRRSQPTHRRRFRQRPCPPAAPPLGQVPVREARRPRQCKPKSPCWRK